MFLLTPFIIIYSRKEPSHGTQGSIGASGRWHAGSDLLSQLASKAGLSSGSASSQLAGLLPELVDKLTPNGKIEAGGLDQLMKLAQGKMGA